MYLIAISLIFLVVWSVWQTRVQTLEQSKGATANMARAMAQQASDTIKSTDNILRGIVAEMESTETHRLKPPALHRLLTEIMQDQPMLSNLSVYDATGAVIAHSYPDRSRLASISDRDYFRFHAQSPDRAPHVAGPILGRITNEWVITISRRVNDQSGRFAGIALATIRVDFFRNYYKEFNIGNFGTILLATDKGILLVRLAQKETAVGYDISKGPVFREYMSKGPVGTAMLVANIDGTERLYSYRHLEQYPLLVAVALSKEDIFATWQTQTYQIIFLTTLLLLLLGIIGVRLVYMINAKDAVEYELRDAKEKLEDLNSELETQASIDVLTGLPNRRKFEATYKIEFQRAARNQSPIAIIMLDVDRFKQYNDRYGHPAGDECLSQIGRMLREKGPNRATDLPARYGGEEMIVLLPDTDLTGAIAIAEKIRLAIRALGIEHTANPDRIVTISAGVAACTPSQADPNLAAHLLKSADKALYAAKAGGRDRVCCEDD